MKKLILIFLFLAYAALALADPAPYVYKFPKPEPGWGQAVAFSNLSPGFFQVMFQDKAGIVRIATYGIEGSSMDKLKDPQLMMVFTFDHPTKVAETFEAAECQASTGQ
ncbi:MAG: hypothetical protein JW782_04715 [Candidatus Saganbacteria bacterium]|nr:hypothetical protein [Candidatus Saganbacteria bacterium]